ncbi:PLDc N-terminal domain-containing protein [Geoalkalibacter halelectricus]|uniref:PLDc N-terminal domain-containing protein n=1 Tax=Geoalkalibacter halelectricus TaxID=2847045 RepID=A0ABY5ZRA8_9BACT|nr:PLDc N-terminal domain-containing protein [Geoalkalibacter halelectricus]MDO3376934.1 PLDc N-terminal domain-containing protein [Geoalkalibacter halelectricus]UWZ81158.1 PLDc N-terminal domain-containing protein [Geoalkalibacter halelectricus]
MGAEMGGILGLVILILVVYAIFNVVLSTAGPWTKVAWVLALILIPGLGVLVWLVLGPRRTRA